LACVLNEMVGIKVAWYWHEMKLHIYGLRIMGWYGFTANMKEVDYKELVFNIYIYICMIDLSWLNGYDWSMSVRNSTSL